MRWWIWWVAPVALGCGVTETIGPDTPHARDAADAAPTPAPPAPADGGTPDAPPVTHDASGPGAPSYVEAACSNTSVVGGTTYYFAVQAFPGKTANALARILAVVPTQATVLAGYRPVATVHVQDGSVAAFCGTTPGSATFVVPADL